MNRPKVQYVLGFGIVFGLSARGAHSRQKNFCRRVRHVHGAAAFMYMLNAASLTLPASLEEIGSYILNPYFEYPDGISGEPVYHKLYKGTVNYNGTTDQWGKIQKGDLGFGSGGSNLECNVQCKNHDTFERRQQNNRRKQRGSAGRKLFIILSAQR